MNNNIPKNGGTKSNVFLCFYSLGSCSSPHSLNPVLQGQSMSSQSSVRVSYGIEEVQAWVAMFGCNSIA